MEIINKEMFKISDTMPTLAINEVLSIKVVEEVLVAELKEVQTVYALIVVG